MKFGGSENLENVDFKLPEDHPGTSKILQKNDRGKPLNVFVGCSVS